MYIETNGQRYPCTYAVVGGDPVCLTLPEGVPETLGETVGLYQDDGFEMLVIAVGDYQRREVTGGTLVLTNQPEPEPSPKPDPVPDPESSLTERLAAVEADQAALAAALERGLSDG